MRRVNRDTNVVVIGAGTAEDAAAVAIHGCWKRKTTSAASPAKSPPAGEKRIADFPQFMKNRIASLDNLMLQIGKRADVAGFRPASASDCQRHRLNAAAATH